MKTKKRTKTITLGLTGGFCSGKTRVTSEFKRLGACCINADTIYHQLIKPKSLIYRKITAQFGPDVLKKNKQIDRKKLSVFAFSDTRALNKLSRITHPVVIKKIRSDVSRLKRGKCPVIIIDAPLLIEAGLLSMVQKLLVIKAKKETQIARAKRRRGLLTDEINKRITAQMPLASKIKLADFIIDNNGTWQQTQKQVRDIWKRLNV